ncbi:hypothetical protein BDV93DRAFT_513194 [Ceratobasidium sp. AG-I]|nr:hypothetical protein BDV93DRAFT_513194 [Ceratobasidium sp. AG-I]
MFKRNGSYQSQVEAAHRFVMENYRPGDDVMLLGFLIYEGVGGLQYAAIRQLATALDAGTTVGSVKSDVPACRVPIKPNWRYVPKVALPAFFPPTVENLLYKRPHRAYVVQRGSWRQIIRKEAEAVQAWMCTDDYYVPWLDWLVLQTSHIIEYNGIDLVDFKNMSGMLTRVSKVTGRDRDGYTYECLVSSYQSFAEGEYDEVCETPLVGPRRL